MSLTTIYPYSPGFQSGQFHHAVLSISGTSHTLYLDGSIVATNTNAANIFTNNASITNTIIGANQLFQNAFQGMIDDVRVYNYAISSTKVSNLYVNRNLVIHYPFDTSVNRLTPNYATLVYDASFVGNAALISPGFIGTSALSITNSNTGGAASQYVISSPYYPLNLNSATGLTISCWINTDISRNTNNIMRIFDIPYSSGIKGISVDISGSSMLYSSYVFNNLNSLVLYWPFDTNMNESINGYTATLYGTTSPTISNSVYKVGTGSLNCSATGITISFVSYTNANGILPISNTYTFSFWYYPTRTSIQYSHLFAFCNSGSNDNIGIYFNLNALDLYVIIKSGTSSIYSSAGTQITNVFLTVNTWNHIALSITSTSSNVYFTLWVNNNKTTYTRASNQGIPQVARQFAFINGATSNDSTTAYVDDFRVYNTILTDTEVTTLYNTK